MQHPGALHRFRDWIASALIGPPALAFLPALTLAAFWLWGETALVIVSLGLPLLFAVTGSFHRKYVQLSSARDSVTGLLLRDGFETSVEALHARCEEAGLRSACFYVDIDEFREFTERHGQIGADLVVQRSGERIVAALREGDIVARIGDSRFAISLRPVHQLDLELCIQLAGRLQEAIEDPISLDGISVYVSCSIGFCLLNQSPGNTGRDWHGAAATALSDAQQNGPSSIRAYSPDMHRRLRARHGLLDDVATALEKGQILAYFQPQISTDTGQITGFEALARWHHPDHGMIPPADFLPLIEEAGLLDRLGQIMLYQALTAQRVWDDAGLDVPCVAVNFAMDELRNPGLVERIRWELDRFDLTPERLTIEILESVVTDCPDDTVTRNVLGLGRLGCRIDLDDFGTGHASIAAIRRFEIHRIKVDRSFVARSDQDPEQQRMIGAILTMAERLEVETLAEGVETVGEHALLAQLGCDHVQGFGIARPMPLDQTLDWIAEHRSKLAEPPPIGSGSSG